MIDIPFRTNPIPLTSSALSPLLRNLGVSAAEIWTVLAVETSGCGFLPDGRPQILFERHIFHRLTRGQYDDGQISDPTPGGYGTRGSHQYMRLSAAIALNRDAALRSASWGIGQIMGMNYARAGFHSVEEMVGAMCESEDHQLTALGAFLVATGLHRFLQAHDWVSFARGFNGPNYFLNNYDVRLSLEFRRLTTGPLPDLNVRAAQLYLTYLGFSPGPIDGFTGQRTISALTAFQSTRNLAPCTMINGDTIAQLRAPFDPSSSGPAGEPLSLNT